MARTSAQLEQAIIARFGTVGLSQVLTDMDTYRNVIASLATQYDTTAAEVKSALKEIAADQAAAIREMVRAVNEGERERVRANAEALRAIEERERAHSQAIIENNRIEARALQAAHDAEIGRQRAVTTQRANFMNLQRLANQALAADARRGVQAEIEANELRTRSDTAYTAFRAARLREQLAETRATAQAELNIEQTRFRDRINFANQYHEQLLRLHRQEREDAARQNQREPWLGLGAGFAGQIAGGGFFSGGMFTGRGAPVAMAGVTAARVGAEQAEKFRESDFAVHRMMTLVGPAERQAGNDFRKMRDEAAELARTLGITIPEAADAMREALTNAIPPEMAGTFVKGANQLAMMEGIDVKSTIASIASIKNAMGLTPTEMTEVPDILFAAMDKGNVKMKDLANQIGQLSGIASQAGVSFKDMMAVLATSTLKGMSGDIAATAARNVFMKAENPTEKVRKEQERILGGKTFRDLIQESGFIEALIEVQQAILKFGSTRKLALGADIRTEKLLAELVSDGGAGMRAARADQEAAIKEGRAKGGAEELLSTEAKQWAKISEQLSQAGQEMGKAVSVFQLTVAKWFMGGFVPGAKTKEGRDVNELVSSGDAKRFGGFWESGGNEARAQMASTWLAYKEKQHGRKFSNVSDVEDYELLEQSPGGKDVHRAEDLKRQDKDLVENINTKLRESQLRAAEARAKAEERRGQKLKQDTDELLKDTLKLEDAYEQLGKSKLGGLNSELEHARNLTEKLFAAVEKGRDALAERSWRVADAQRDRAANFLGGAGKLFGLARRGETSQRFIEGEHADKMASRAAGAFGSMDPEALLSVGQTGRLDYNEVRKYIDAELKRRGPQSTASTMMQRTDLWKEADRVATDIRSAYLEFRSDRTNKESDFGKWFQDKKLTETEALQTKAMEKEQKTNEDKLAKASELMTQINDAYIVQRDLAAAITDQFRAARDVTEQFAGNLEGGLAALQGIASMLGLTHAKQEAGPTGADFKPTFRGLDAKSGFQDPLGFKNAGAAFAAPPGGSTIVAAPSTTVNIGSITVDTVEQKEALAKKLGDAIIVKVREAQDRGAGTTDTHK